MYWPMFRKVERHARRLHDMIDRLDVDTISLVRFREGEAYAEARTKCLFCVNAAECLKWLDCETQESGRPVFCPNLALLERFQRSAELNRPHREEPACDR